MIQDIRNGVNGSDQSLLVPVEKKYVDELWCKPKSYDNGKKVIYPPGAHLPNRDMASRHSTGYSLLIGQELVLEHEYAEEVRHMR